MTNPSHLTQKLFNATVVVTGLGYFVDMYDLFLFVVVRMTSLADLGLSGEALTDTGLFILNMQMIGLLLGAIFWGMLSDKFGRKSCLLASILAYSLATLACGFVQNPDQYAVLRFISGFGLAGEVGMGITLITEHMKPDRRGMGVAIFASLGFLGILAASAASEFLPWRYTYILGGTAGLILLVARSYLMESGMFASLKQKTHMRGDLRIIFSQPKLLKKYLCTILLAAPIPFVVLIYSFAPEIAAGMGITDPVKSSIAAGTFQVFLITGDILSALASDRLRSRKQTIRFLKSLGFVVLLAFIFLPKSSPLHFYMCIAAFGIALGYWVLINAIAAEQFGTNIRATAATTIPNFVRALVILYALAFKELRHIDITFAVGVIGFAVFIASALALRGVEETYGKDLNYVEDTSQK